MEIAMRQRRNFIAIAVCVWLSFHAGVAHAQLGELPPGAVSTSRMGSAEEIVVYVAFDPAIVRGLVPEGLRFRTLEEIAARGNSAIADYIRSRPEHKGWASSVVEIIHPESLEYDGYTARLGKRGGMAVWYANVVRTDSSETRPKGWQSLALATWLSDKKLVEYLRAKGYPAEYAEIEYWQDSSGVVHGRLRADSLRVVGRCKLAGSPKPADFGKPPIFQTVWPPRPLAETFEVVTFYGHLRQDCGTADWQINGEHQLVKAFPGRAC